jgi:hypothetical protein
VIPAKRIFTEAPASAFARVRVHLAAEFSSPAA